MNNLHTEMTAELATYWASQNNDGRGASVGDCHDTCDCSIDAACASAGWEIVGEVDDVTLATSQHGIQYLIADSYGPWAVEIPPPRIVSISITQGGGVLECVDGEFDAEWWAMAMVEAMADRLKLADDAVTATVTPHESGGHDSVKVEWNAPHPDAYAANNEIIAQIQEVTETLRKMTPPA